MWWPVAQWRLKFSIFFSFCRKVGEIGQVVLRNRNGIEKLIWKCIGEWDNFGYTYSLAFASRCALSRLSDHKMENFFDLIQQPLIDGIMCVCARLCGMYVGYAFSYGKINRTPIYEMAVAPGFRRAFACAPWSLSECCTTFHYLTYIWFLCLISHFVCIQDTTERIHMMNILSVWICFISSVGSWYSWVDTQCTFSVSLYHHSICLNRYNSSILPFILHIWMIQQQHRPFVHRACMRARKKRQKEAEEEDATRRKDITVLYCFSFFHSSLFSIHHLFVSWHRTSFVHIRSQSHTHLQCERVQTHTRAYTERPIETTHICNNIITFRGHNFSFLFIPTVQRCIRIHIFVLLLLCLHLCDGTAVDVFRFVSTSLHPIGIV